MAESLLTRTLSSQCDLCKKSVNARCPASYKQVEGNKATYTEGGVKMRKSI